MAELPTDTPTASSRDEAGAYDAWLRAKVEKAIASTEPGIPHEQVMAEVRQIIERARSR
ncbi:stability determinant [Sphingomonas yunnanensis]|uniref:type II toxin-antitoxin system RelB family antitoxin n=1 Tax=Sphingomonas yunnanensis TaxID=310400 RepID=UPI001CA60F72|nr:stability determinant [Sphingomonas yunnanensis]MBY9062872.1 stability determinant [Sphingomonas yunnanensis]